MVVAYAAFFSVGILVPLWLQRNLGFTPIWAGFATAPIGILPVILTPFVGRYAHKFDLRWLATIAFIAMSMTSFARSGFNLEVDFRHIALAQLFPGFGVALFFMPVLQILLSDLQPHEIAAGSGLATFMRTLGGSFAASLTTYAWTERGAVHHAHITEKLSAYDPATTGTIARLGGGDLQRGAAILERMISNQAAQIGFNEIFHLLGMIFLAVIVFVWFAKPPFTPKVGGTAEAAGGH
jgi:DHA2 family multidrug resistance protein